MKIIITHDVFDISKRIKELNQNYYFVYDNIKKRFELHNSGYKDSFCLVIPYKELDIRTIEYVRKSEKVDEVIKEIDINNQKIENSKISNALDRSNYQLNEIYNYANRKCKDFDGKAYIAKWC